MQLTVSLFWSVFCSLIFISSAVEYSNRWTVQIDGNNDEANKLARKHGFVNHGKIIDDYYSFEHQKVEREGNVPSTHLHKGLTSEPNVKMVEQQELKSYNLLSSQSVEFYTNDKRFDDMWYINRDDGQPTYNVIDVWKRNITGAGVVVTVVDEGLDPEHPEIKDNYDEKASFDFIDNDTIPVPLNKSYAVYGHGDKCAGVIAAVLNNSNCGVGLAYKAKLGGIRLFFKKKASDADEARALSHATDHIDIYSNSWGPRDKGMEVTGPGHLAQRALRNGAEKGRGGLGSIYVFAAGNGGIIVEDSCAFNGYVNNIYTIAITGINSDGSIPGYGEHCAGIMAVTYSRDIFGDNSKLITADTNKACTDDFGASSAATAMASGLIALMLSANPGLSWRDVQHIIARTSRPGPVKISDWNTNKAQLLVNDYVGFGLMDASKMVDAAVNWTTVPSKVVCTISRLGVNRSIPSQETLEEMLDLSKWSDTCGDKINYLEHVEVRVSLTYTLRGELLIKLVSPQGTVSNLTHYRESDASFGARDLNWVLMTLHHWGENATGPWKLTLENSHPHHDNTGLLFDWTLILHGTTLNPLENNPHVTSASPQPTEETPTTDSPTQSIKYFVRITSDTDYPRRGNDLKIQLFGVRGTTDERKLMPIRNVHLGGSSQLYYVWGRPVGYLTKVALIQKPDPRNPSAYLWFFKEVAVQPEGNNPWIKFPYDSFIWSTAKVNLKRDIDECGRRNGGCSHGCINTQGSFYCTCPKGYRLRSSSKRRCRDINECNKDNGGCQQICTNMVGTYRCSCNPGYRISSSDERRCEAKNVPEVRSRPKSCKDVQQQNHSYVQNSEYRIYPVKECNTFLKVYCHHDTKTADPKEYITVEEEHNYVSDWRGTTYFSKVRLVPDKMLIDRSDTRYATFYKAYWRNEQKKHHFASPSSHCLGSNGRFSLNLSGTGLSIDQNWFIAPWITSVWPRRKKGALYTVGCNHQRQCKVCGPKHDLVLSIDRC